MIKENVVTFDSHQIKEVHLPDLGTDFIDWGLHTIMAPTAWERTKGENIKVAVLDTGIDYNHPDLINNVKDHKDFTNSPSASLDIQGHGTHVAGIIAGSDNGVGITGVAPDAEIYAGKVLGDNGSGSFGSIIKGIRWAISKKVDIINMSLGTAKQPPNDFYEAIKQAKAQGIVIVAATGNANSSVCYPARYDEVIAVGAIDNKYDKASFSNYGVKNEITAPGVDILSCYKNKGYAKLSGTSMATPIITGSIALYLSIHKNFSKSVNIDVIHKAISQATVDLGNDGKDEYFGAGLINLAKLI
ncbi:S8 family peptidase [Virgibacillus salexigens]|uniref:Subtilisin BL n=1 Tax=Virgibacillus massiliensis TaxID=1462526 RepID=A0A024QGT0_9BACI|nr:S8 family peptidase [Virgibacillus massiliensis]CDQ41763.1 Subtilisin BL [Virgibacillus massiliensis]